MESTGSVGVCGLGVMGRAMAENLLRAGFDVMVHNRSAERCGPLVALGARPADAPEQLAGECEVVLTVLSDDGAVSAVVERMLSEAPPGRVIVDSSSIAPATARALHRRAAVRSVAFVDAPVSGGERGAREGTLSFMVGGDTADVRRVRAILEVLGSRLVHVGGPGSGQVAKAANQVVVGLTIQAVAEGLSLAASAGADPEVVREALLGGFAGGTVMDQHGERMVEHDFEPGARLALHRKDLGIALDLAAESDIRLSATEHLAEMMDELIAQGEGDRDHAILARAYPWQGDPHGRAVRPRADRAGGRER